MILTYNPQLAAQIGLEEAIIVNQLQYWEQRATTILDGVKWVYKSLTDWMNETGLTLHKTRRAISNLVEIGLVAKERHWSKQWHQICFYRLNYERLKALISSRCGKSTSQGEDFPNLEISKTVSSSICTENTSIDFSQTAQNFEQEREKSNKLKERKKSRSRSNRQKELQAPTHKSQSQISYQPQAKTSHSGQSSAPAPRSVENDLKQEQWPQAEGKPDLNPDFKRWLISRAERLGKSDPLSWALTVIKNPDPILVAEFHQYQQPQPTQIQDSACLHEEAEAENPILAAFNRLKAKWNCPYPPLQKKFRAEVSREIEAHPEWGIWISPDLELFLADQALSVQTESSRSEMWNSSESECHELEADCLAAVSEHNHRTWQESRVLKTPLVHSQIRAEQSDFLPEAPPEDLMDLIVEIQTRFKLLLGWSDDRFQTWLQEGFGHSRLEVLTDAELHQVKERLERTSNQSNRNLPLNQRSVNEEKLNLANDLYSMP